MTEKEKNECCGGKSNKVWDGFMFGIGFSFAIMAASIGVTILSVVIYYTLKIVGISF